MADLDVSIAGTGAFERCALPVGRRFPVFEAIFRLHPLGIDRAQKSCFGRRFDAHPVGAGDRQIEWPIRRAPARRTVVADFGSAQVGEAGGAVFPFDRVEQLAAQRGAHERRRPERPEVRGGPCLDPGHQRRTDARATEQLPAAMAVGVIDGDRRVRVRNGRDVGDRAPGAADVFLPGGLWLIFAAAAAGAGPGGLRPPARAGFFSLQFGSADSDHVGGGDRVLGAIPAIAGREENGHAGLEESVEFGLI